MVEAPAPSTVDPRLIQWLAAQALHERDARLVDGGAEADDRIELAHVFIDLPVAVAHSGRRAPSPNKTGMAALLGALTQASGGMRALLVGGPGSGKSTLTTMLAQVLRLPRLDAHHALLPPALQELWSRARVELDALVAREKWPATDHVLPLRVNLPALARWMASHRDGDEPILWQHLAARAVDELAAHDLLWEVTPAQFRQAVGEAGPVAWILDGLDEVPRTAGRAEVIEAVRAVVCEQTATIAGIVVATRPQGYEGEFDELDAMTLLPLPAKLALEYGERLIRTWAQRASASDVTDRLRAMHDEFAKPEVAALLQTPLHTTIAAVLVAGRGTLPKSRYLLFKEYFDTVLRRELRKPIEHKVTDEDGGLLRTLHAQAGLLLHVRAQAQQGARASLRRRELSELLFAIYGGLGYENDERRTKVERLLRFAAERLVLLIHDVQGEYSFGVRSLQEFFAAEALMEGDASVVAVRLDAVVRSSHWSNVVAFVVSRHALATSQNERTAALRFTVERCIALNHGVAGEPAKRCLLGSHLALAMLREVQSYANPWLLGELWKVAFEAASTPTQEGSARAVQLERSRVRRGRETWWDIVEIHTRLGMTAARQTGECGARWRRQLCETAGALFARGGEIAWVAWRLINGLLVVGDREAEHLATSHAPDNETDAWAAFYAGAWGGDDVLPAWWCDYVNEHPSWFTPGRFAQRFLDPDTQRPVVALNIVTGFLLDPTKVTVALESPTTSLAWVPIDYRPALPAAMPDVSPAWQVWHLVAAFLASPSRASLADVLDLLAHPDALRELYACIEGLPWPLAACVARVCDGDDSSKLAQELRDGALSDIDDWRAAEQRLCSYATLSSDAWEALWTARRPWPREISTSGVPIPSELGYDEYTDPIVHWIESNLDRGSVVLRLLARGPHSSSGSPRFHEFVDYQHLCDDPHWSSWRFAIRLDRKDTDQNDWLALLDARGRLGLNSPFGAIVWDDSRKALRALLSHLREHPAQWGLIDAIVSLLVFLPDLTQEERSLPELPVDASPRAHAQHALITLCGGLFAPEERDVLLARLVWGDGAHDLRTALAQTLQRRAGRHEPAMDLLLAALDAPPPPTPEARDALLGALFEHARRLAPPAFATPEAWNDAHLPPPFLSGQAPPRLPPVLRSIDVLRNVRLFTDTPTVDAPFPRPASDRGQWIVLVGENGVGKTTLLRALALALAPPAVASKLLDERLPLVRNGGDASVAVTLDTGRREIVIRREGRTEVIDAVAPPAEEPPWVVAYGVRRGNALGEKDRATELGAVGEFHTLFERPAALYPAAQWLRDLDGDVLREQRRSPRKEGAPPGPREAVWQSVVQALQTILGVTAVEVKDGGAVYVTHPEFGHVPFEAMSDGYLGTAGWIIDMIARWIDRQSSDDEPIGPHVLRQMCGLALIDEIDLHLHPVWQLRIIRDVRQLFPRMSFIVTTHNPLALQGARAGEIFVMRRQGARVELVQRDIRPGQDVDRVLFEQFGVKHTLDQGTRELLDEHRRMVEQAVPPDNDARRRVEGRLIERFGDVGATLRDERGAEDVSPLRPDEQGLVDDLLKPS